jgi:hypothetical protein
MITSTWQSIRDGATKVPVEYTFYLVRDDNHVFYVGMHKSSHSFAREGASLRIRSRFHRVRRFLDYHAPRSDEWQVDFLTLQDAITLLQLSQQKVDEWFSIFWNERTVYHWIEVDLIKYYRPYLNKTNNLRLFHPLPETYAIPLEMRAYYHLR